MRQGRKHQPSSYKVNEVARITGLSVRALHHYDQIGLVVPRARSRGGYRLYDDADLLRLQQVLIGRELGLSLEDIKRSLDEPGFDRKAALRDQLRQLRARATQTTEMIAAVQRALEISDGIDTSEEPNMKEIFAGFDPKKYEQEAQQRWGHTNAYAEAARRTGRYTPEDWKKLGEEQSAIYADLAAAKQAGKDPGSEEVMAIAERHRLSMDRWFYPCSHEQHRGLADLYENDRRYAANMDKFGAGLTDFLIPAIRANAAKNAGSA